MATRSVIVELRYNPRLEAQATSVPDSAGLDTASLPEIAGIAFDSSFAPVRLPAIVSRPRTGDPSDIGVPVAIDPEPEHPTYIVRAQADENEAVEALREDEAVVGVFSDPRIEPWLTCANTPPVGDDQDVEGLLSVDELKSCDMDGSGVLVAIVDTGVNLAYLNSKGKNPSFSVSGSWGYEPSLPLGSMPVDHGTMCAFDVCIAAPACTILDIALMRTIPDFETLLSDAVKAYSHLLNVMTAPRRLGHLRSLVVSNSWGMFHPSWDYPPGDPGNYSDNPNHPFNTSVAALEAAGADILFDAGNCGVDCPDPRCKGVTTNTIYGANGHPQVLTVAGVDTNLQRVGYSAIGPGRLAQEKPDIAGYTHFKGSDVYTSDSGTSAATPVVAGVVAAVRSRRRYDPSTASTWPAVIRSLVTSTAFDLGSPGFDYLYGHGVVDGFELKTKLCPLWSIKDFCKAHPWLCKDISWPEIEIPGPPIRELPDLTDPAVLSTIDRLATVSGGIDRLELAYMIGMLQGRQMAEPTAASHSAAQAGQQAGTKDG